MSVTTPVASSSNALATCQRAVIKIGSSLLVGVDGALQRDWLAALCADIAALRARGVELLIVTSGAVGLGRRALGLAAGTLRLEEKQAAAAAGQIVLAQAYRDGLAAHGHSTAQILLTLDDTENRRRYLNARSTVRTLLNLRAVPVVNENDTVATTELRFGDNDRLSARVAVMVSADLLVLLSDVDGLYDANPMTMKSARHIPQVARITRAIEAMAGGSGSAVGTGGMVSKLAAAKIATRAGCTVLLGSGQVNHPLQRLQDGARHTLFVAHTSPRSARKDWIAAKLDVMGVLHLDAGAVAALQRGKSLLPRGVVTVEGNFARGDAVLLRGPDGSDCAKGLSAYDAVDAQRLIGSKTAEIEQRLGYAGRHELVHRDDLVMLHADTLC